MNRSACSSEDPLSAVTYVRTDEPSSDLALMADFAARRERAAGVLYDRFASRIYGLGVVMLGNHPAAQDLVQDTFVKLWRTADRYDPQRGRLETWVLLTARSLAIDALRRRVLESRSLQSVGVQPEHDPEPLPDEQAAVADLSARARRAMGVLPPEQRSALELAYFGGRTTAEVAALEGIPQGTVKSRIRAALLRLRAEMAKESER
jgi:RNA polymerase sigma-70 factor (ECF subfamily)